MDAIPPDVARKLLNRDFANLVKRVQAGGKLSRTERAMLQSMAATTLGARARGVLLFPPRDETEGGVTLLGGEAVLRGAGRRWEDRLKDISRGAVDRCDETDYR